MYVTNAGKKKPAYLAGFLALDLLAFGGGAWGRGGDSSIRLSTSSSDGMVGLGFIGYLPEVEASRPYLLRAAG